MRLSRIKDIYRVGLFVLEGEEISRSIKRGIAKMIPELKLVVFAHCLMNPPTEYRSNTVHLTLKNSKEITLTKEAKASQWPQIQYLLSVPNPLNLGLPSAESNIDNFLRDVVLAFNLILDKTALSIREQNISEYNVKYKEAEHDIEEDSEGCATIIDDVLGDRTNRMVICSEKIRIRGHERDHVEVVSTETLNENELINALNLISKAARHEAPNSSKPFPKKQKLSNLSKALHTYETAMSDFDTRTIFRDLYSSLEFATNWDRNLTGPTLDAEITRLTKVPQTQTEDWRRLYNRVKHIDKNPTQLATFEKGMEKLSLRIDPLRVASKEVIIQRLKPL